jgi:ABC-type antimicrobial peptide transport system permease subunit
MQSKNKLTKIETKIVLGTVIVTWPSVDRWDLRARHNRSKSSASGSVDITCPTLFLFFLIFNFKNISIF